ncbi:MAG: fumarate reductase subunit FrdD [Burkholderiales bacterium]
MSKSNKPIVWLPFAAGGTITALLTPALILLTLAVALGHVPQGLTYDGMRAFASQIVGKVLIFVVLALSLWSAAHRLRITFHDFGVRRDPLVAALVYTGAAIGTLVLLVSLWML